MTILITFSIASSNLRFTVQELALTHHSGSNLQSSTLTLLIFLIHHLDLVTLQYFFCDSLTPIQIFNLQYIFANIFL